MGFYRQVQAIVWKDLLAEFRTKESLSAMLVFSLLVMIAFNFAFEPGMKSRQEVGPGILWVAFSFAGILGLNRTFVYEKDKECIQGLMLCPVDHGSIYIAKLIGNLIFMFIVEMITLPIFAVFFNISIINILFSLVVVIFLTTVGFSSVGTIFSAISVNTRARDVMFPILFLPIVFPIIMGAVKMTGRIFDGKGLFDEVVSSWLVLVGAFDIIFLVVSFLVFEYVIEE